MELIRTLQCPCDPGFVWSSRQTFSAHKRSKKHRVWSERQKSDQIDATKKDNAMFTLNLKLKDREEQIEKLILEKAELVKKVADLERALSDKADEFHILARYCSRMKKCKTS